MCVCVFQRVHPGHTQRHMAAAAGIMCTFVINMVSVCVFQRVCPGHTQRHMAAAVAIVCTFVINMVNVCVFQRVCPGHTWRHTAAASQRQCNLHSTGNQCLLFFLVLWVGVGGGGADAVTLSICISPLPPFSKYIYISMTLWGKRNCVIYVVGHQSTSTKGRTTLKDSCPNWSAKPNPPKGLVILKDRNTWTRLKINDKNQTSCHWKARTVSNICQYTNWPNILQFKR